MDIRRHLVVVLALGCAVLLSACQVRIASGIEVNPDGSGRVEVLVALDGELTADLLAADIDPFAGLDGPIAGWSVTREDIDGGQAVRVSSEFASPGDLTVRVDELNDGLAEGDPRVLDQVALAVAADGSSTFSARAGLEPPNSTGIQAQGLGPTGDDLKALLDAAGQDLVRVEVRLTLPGDVLTVATGDGLDGPVVEGRTVVWDLPPTGLVVIEATGAAGSDRTLVYAGAAALIGLALGAAAMAVRRKES